jgi:hypothetical protein
MLQGDAIGAARDRFGMRINHFSVQGNHIHFIHLKHLDSAQIGWMDDFSSEKHAAVTMPPATWLLRNRSP